MNKLKKIRWNGILIKASRYTMIKRRRDNATQKTRNQICILIYLIRTNTSILNTDLHQGNDDLIFIAVIFTSVVILYFSFTPGNLVDLQRTQASQQQLAYLKQCHTDRHFHHRQLRLVVRMPNARTIFVVACCTITSININK